MKRRLARFSQLVNEELEDTGLHRLRRGENDKPQQADGKEAKKGSQVAEQAKIDFQGRSGRFDRVAHCVRVALIPTGECSMLPYGY